MDTNSLTGSSRFYLKRYDRPENEDIQTKEVELVKVEEQDVMKEGINPLDVDLILDNVFRFCNRYQLNDCRLVNKHWYKLSLPYWLKKGPCLKLCGDKRMRKKSIRLLDMSNFLNKIHLTDELLGVRRYQKFMLMSYKERSDCKLFNSFWNLTGRWITHLVLDNFIFKDIHLFRNVLCSKFTPKLVKLRAKYGYAGYDDFRTKVDYSQIDHDFLSVEGPVQDINKNLKSLHISFICIPIEIVYRLPISWIELLLHYPNLQYLSVGRMKKNSEMEVQRILNAIKTIRLRDEKKLRLKSLELVELDDYTYKIGQLSPSLFTFFSDTQLFLERLALDIGNKTVASDLYKILAFQANTLKRLCVFRASPLEAFEFPEMNVLEEIYLFGYPFTSLNFLKKMRSLKSLNLNMFSDYFELEHRGNVVNTTRQQEMDEEVFPSITTFRCSHETKWSRENFTRLKGWMPNLTTLKIALRNEEIFRMACGFWPDIETFQVISNRIGDEGITGLVDGNEATDDNRITPNITCLKNLKVFTLVDAIKERPFCPSPRWRLTDKSVVHGFLQVPKLEKLKFTAYNTCSINQATYDALKKKLSAFMIRANKWSYPRKIYPRDDSDDDSSDDDYCCDDSYVSSDDLYCSDESDNSSDDDYCCDER